MPIRPSPVFGTKNLAYPVNFGFLPLIQDNVNFLCCLVPCLRGPCASSPVENSNSDKDLCKYTCQGPPAVKHVLCTAPHAVSIEYALFCGHISAQLSMEGPQTDTLSFPTYLNLHKTLEFLRSANSNKHPPIFPRWILWNVRSLPRNNHTIPSFPWTPDKFG